MLSRIRLMLLLLGVGLLGCSKRDDAAKQGIPDIPPGRSSQQRGDGEQYPVPKPPK